MPNLIFRISKSNSNMEHGVQWSNRYVLDCPYAVGSDECEHDARMLAYGEACLHLETTSYYLVTVGNYGQQANSSYSTTEAAYPLTRHGLTGLRVANDQAPDEIGLMMTKQVANGRNGKALYFGALNRGDYSVNRDGELVLTAAGELQYLLDYHVYGLYWGNLIGTVVSPENEDRNQVSWNFRPWTMRLGHATAANARKRAIAKRREKAVGAWSRVSGTLWLAATHIQAIREGIAEGHDFQYEGIQQWTLSIITGCMEAYDAVKSWIETGELDDDGETVYPATRFGPSFERVLEMNDAIQGRAEQDIESAGKLGPYEWFGDQKYIHLEDAKALLDYAVVWQAKIGELADFDYFTPIYIRGE